MKSKSYYIVLDRNRLVLETLSKGHAWYCASMSGTKLVRVTRKGHIIEAWERTPVEVCYTKHRKRWDGLSDMSSWEGLGTHMWFKVA